MGPRRSPARGAGRRPAARPLDSPLASQGESISDGDPSDASGSDVIEMTVDTPHLAYLARVACTSDKGREDLPGADVIAFVDARMRDAG